MREGKLYTAYGSDKAQRELTFYALNAWIITILLRETLWHIHGLCRWPQRGRGVKVCVIQYTPTILSGIPHRFLNFLKGQFKLHTLRITNFSRKWPGTCFMIKVIMTGFLTICQYENNTRSFVSAYPHWNRLCVPIMVFQGQYIVYITGGENQPPSRNWSKDHRAFWEHDASPCSAFLATGSNIL